MMGLPRSETYNQLEQAIMTWKISRMKEYLTKIKCKSYGTKKVMTMRIMGAMPIEDAIRTMKEYRMMVQAEKEGKEMDIEAEVEITDVEMAEMETALKRKREGREEDLPGKQKEYEEMPPPAPPHDGARYDCG